MSQTIYLTPTTGPGSGTVTSISAATGITLTPNPITTTGTVGLTIPVVVTSGGTGFITATTAYAPICAGTTATGAFQVASTGLATAGFVLTSNGSSAVPSFQAIPSLGITTLNGDTGSVTGTTVSIKGNGATNAGSTVSFSGSGTAMTFNTTDSNGNVIIGQGSGNGSISGTSNAGIGSFVLSALNSGSGNYAGAQGALQKLTSGSFNTALSNIAGNNLLTGSYNQLIGFATGFAYTSSESSNICLGHNVQGTVGDSNTLIVGAGTGTGNGQINRSFISGINGITVTGTAVLVSSSDQLGVAVSSAKYKDNIQDMGDISSRALNLRPVTFSYKGGNDTRFGLIAEEVHEVLPELVVYDKSGEPQTVMYQELPALLLNELKKALKRIEVLEAKLGA